MVSRRRPGLVSDRRGASFAEYLIVIAVVCVAGMGAFGMFSGKVQSTTQQQGSCLPSMPCGKQGGVSNVSPGSNTPPGGNPLDPYGGGVELGTVEPGGVDPTGESGAGDGDGGGGGVFGWIGNQLGNAVKGAVLGSWGGNTGWAGFAAKIGVGMIPIVGQIADARDTIYSIVQVVKKPTSGKAWLDLGASALGWVPLVGDAAKESIKNGQKVAELVKVLKPWIKWSGRTYGAANQAAKGEPEK